MIPISPLEIKMDKHEQHPSLEREAVAVSKIQSRQDALTVY